MQYLYESGDEAVLMDLSDYDQLSPPRSSVGESLDWMVPNDEVDVLFVDDQPTDIQVPSAVELAVTKTQPRSRRHGFGRRNETGDARVRGDRAGAAVRQRR